MNETPLGEGKAPSRSYLLRLWRASPIGAAGWRASLEDPRTGERYGFAGMEELFAFLIDQMGLETGHRPDRQENR